MGIYWPMKWINWYSITGLPRSFIINMDNGHQPVDEAMIQDFFRTIEGVSSKYCIQICLYIFILMYRAYRSA